MKEPRDEAAGVMSAFLWNRYEFLLPESPGYVTQQLLRELDKAGLEIKHKETGGTIE